MLRKGSEIPNVEVLNDTNIQMLTNFFCKNIPLRTIHTCIAQTFFFYHGFTELTT